MVNVKLKLLQEYSIIYIRSNKIFLPSACGGGGTCIQCECHVLSGGGEALPTETPHFQEKN